MDVFVETDPKERLLVIPNTRIRVNVLVEHPRTNWKRIEVRIVYDSSLSHPSSSHTITERNESRMSSFSEELIAPSKFGELPLGDLFVNVDGAERSHYLPTIRILSETGFFEELVAGSLRRLGFEVSRFSRQNMPGLEVFHRRRASERIHVEATPESFYGVQDFERHLAKFRKFERSRIYRRLLIVVFGTVAESVRRRISRSPQLISIVSYRELTRLDFELQNGTISSYEVIEVFLDRKGLIGMERSM